MSRWEHGPSTLLKNLQSYKLVTGQLDPNRLYREQRRKSGRRDDVHLEQGGIVGSVLHESLRAERPAKRQRHEAVTAGKVGYGFERPDMAVPGEFSLTKRSVNRHESSSSHPPSTPAERSVLTTPTASLFPGYRPYDDARVPKPKNATVGQNSNNNVAYGLNIAADDAAAIRSEHKNPKPVDFFGLSNLFVDEDADGSDIDEDGEDLVHEDRVHSVRHDTTGTTSVKSPHLQPINALDALASLYGDDNSDDEEERSFGNGTHHFHTFLQPSPSSTMTSWRCEKDQQRNRSTNRVCDLAGTLCWKCQVRGHLAEDCTTYPDDRPSFAHDKPANEHSNLLRDYRRRVHHIQRTPGAKCVMCGVEWNLACCLDCDAIFCDGKGHLTDHLLENPSHGKLYSFKLRRQVKCSKPSCEVIDAQDLRRCATCLSKAFDADYDLINATWSRRGLLKIPKAIACDEHFHWHRLNCDRSQELYSGVVVDRDMLVSGVYEGTLSEHLF